MGAARDRLPNGCDQGRHDLRQHGSSQHLPSVHSGGHFPRFTPEAIKTNLAFVDTLRAFAVRKHPTPAQIALAWLLTQKPWIVPIPGMNAVEHLEENLASVHVVLTPEDLCEIDLAASRIEVQGARLSDGLLGLSE